MSDSQPPAGGREVLGADDVSRALTRIAHWSHSCTRGSAGLARLGVPARGLPLSERLATRSAAVEPGFDPASQSGSLDITMHRDALHRAPVRTLGTTDLPPGGID